MAKLSKKEARCRRHRRLRGKISGCPEIPRMSVWRSGKNLYVQFIDDVAQCTLASVSTLGKEFREGGKKVDMEGAAALGKMAAERAKAVNISRVVFDRGGLQFHGRIKALADAAREAGLTF